MTHTSALLELVGLRDMAEEEPDSFENITAEYRSVVTSYLEDEKIDHLIWIDSCFLQSKNPKPIVEAVMYLRDRLLSAPRPIFSRSVILQDSFQKKKGQFSRGAARLQGKLLRLKACAIDVDDSLAKELIKGDSELISNFYFPPKVGMLKYWDLGFPQTSQVQVDLKIKNLFQELIHALNRSTKSQRFFSPLLINLSRHLIGKKLDEFIKILDTDEVFNLIKKKLPEGEFIFYTLLDRHFEEGIDLTNSAEKILEHWASFERGWLLDRLNKENKNGPIPDIIIRPEFRGKWRSFARKHISTIKDSSTSEST